VRFSDFCGAAVIFRPLPRITLPERSGISGRIGKSRQMAHDSSIMAAADLSDSFRELLERHRKIVFKVANTYCRDPHDRADLAQEIAAQLWRSFPAYDGQRVFSTWMYRIALNVAISFRRHSGLRERHTVALDEDLHDAADHGAGPHDDSVQALYRCIDKLDPLNRALLLLYLDERSQREIADVLGITETNVATKIGRLKQRLRDEMVNA
jgi:RNA polymerase sigma factor (sigma-70 family)